MAYVTVRHLNDNDYKKVNDIFKDENLLKKY